MIFTMVALLCRTIGAVTAWKEEHQFVVYAATLVRLTVFFTFILGIQILLGRPPMRVMGETRL